MLNKYKTVLNINWHGCKEQVYIYSDRWSVLIYSLKKEKKKAPLWKMIHLVYTYINNEFIKYNIVSAF